MTVCRLRRFDSKILVAGGPRHEQDRLPTWKQICDIKSGKGRYVIELFAGAGGAACGIKLAGGISLAGFDNLSYLSGLI